MPMLFWLPMIFASALWEISGFPQQPKQTTTRLPPDSVSASFAPLEIAEDGAQRRSAQPLVSWAAARSMSTLDRAA
jgi:hypothetical protein